MHELRVKILRVLSTAAMDPIDDGIIILLCLRPRVFHNVRVCRRQYVALKVQKSADHYTEAARDEIDLLQTVRANAEALKELADQDPA